MGSCSLLQGIFPTQGLNPGLPHCRQSLCYLSHQGRVRSTEAWSSISSASDSISSKIWIKTCSSVSHSKAAAKWLLPRDRGLPFGSQVQFFSAAGGLWTGNPASFLTLPGPEPSHSPLCCGGPQHTGSCFLSSLLS